MEFNPPEAVNVTNDELCFSSLIATLQLDEDEGDAFLLLGNWLPPAAQRHGIMHCNALAQELLVAGHVFSRRNPGIGQNYEPNDRHISPKRLVVENEIK